MAIFTENLSFEGGRTYYFRFTPQANIFGTAMFFKSFMDEMTGVEAILDMSTMDYKPAKTSAEFAAK